jgi:3-oxoacyl-[acyl-carrier protein] reductase
MQPLTDGLSSPPDLHGRVALVTGAGRGIGRAIAETLAEAGADVAVLDLQPPTATVSTIQTIGRRGLALAGDVAERADVQQAINQTVETFGRIDVLVNNAGVVERSTLDDLDDATFQREIDVIARGTYLCTQAVYAVMKRQGGGKIVNISSISGKLSGAFSAPTSAGANPGAQSANPGAQSASPGPPSASPGPPSTRSGPAYALAKGGVIAFTKWVARDGGPHGIQVNAICPGTIDTEMTRGYTYNIGNVPVGRIGSPRDVALAVLFLASQMSNYVTGQTLNVDGGILMD